MLTRRLVGHVCAPAPQVKKIVERAYRRAKDLLTTNMDVLHKVAAVLIEKENLDGEEFQKVRRGCGVCGVRAEVVGKGRWEGERGCVCNLCAAVGTIGVHVCPPASAYLLFLLHTILPPRLH